MERVRVTGTHLCPLSAVIVALLALAGCGGSNGTPAVGEAGVQSPVIARADAICRRANAELASNLPKSVSLRAVAAVSPRNAALERRAVEELTKLEPPRSIEAQWRLVIAYRRTLAHALTEVAQAARTGNRAAVNKLGASKARVRSKLLALGKYLGFTSCQQLG